MMADTAEAPSMLDAALSLAAQGFPVFPCIENGKLPAIGAWQQRATTDPAQIRKLWTSWDPVLEVERTKDYNIGIKTGDLGQGRYLLAVDTDVKDGRKGEQTLAELDMLDGTPGWLETRTHTSPTGSRHYLYISPIATGNTASTALGPGIDTRGEGGYIVGPGSTIDGIPYRVVDGRDPIAAPKWLVDKIGQPVARSDAGSVVELLDTRISIDRAADFLRTAPVAVEGQGGDALTFKTACKVGDFGVSELTCLELMLAWNDRCSPPWSYEELAVKVANAYSYRKMALGERSAEGDFDPIPDEEKPPQGFAIPADFADREPPPREWLVEGLIPLRKTTLLTGDGGVGKTLAAQQLATATATGTEWFGRKIKPCRTLAVFSEDDTDELWRRQRDICAAMGVDMHRVKDTLWWSADHVADKGCVLMAFSSANPAGKHGPFFAELERAIVEQKIELLILDPIANMFAGSELDRTQVTGFVNRTLNRLCARHGVTVLVLAHPSLSGILEGSGRSGSTGWSNAVRSRLYLTRDKEDATGDYRVLKTTKANYGRFGEEILLRWRSGAFVPVASGEIDPETRADSVLITTLKTRVERGDILSSSPRAGNYIVKAAMVTPEGRGFGRQILETALERLLRNGSIVNGTMKNSSRHDVPALLLGDGVGAFEKPDISELD